MTQYVYPGETLTKQVAYTNTGIDLTAATVLIASGAYTTTPTVWETPSAVDRTSAATGTLLVSIVYTTGRPSGRQWVWVKVTLGSSVDEFRSSNESVFVNAA